MIKVGMIGYGHMAGAMAKGLIKSGLVEGRDIYVSASNYEELKKRAEIDGVCPMDSNASAVRESNLVILAVKPDKVEPVLREIKEDLMGRIVISVAFGIGFDALDKYLAPETKHISIIPNTPCEVCQGITICEDKHNLTEPELDTVKTVLKGLGEIIFLPEEKMWLAGELASCGPAFGAMFIEALGDGAVKYGLDEKTAYEITSMMLAGTGRLQVELGKAPGKMVEEVATPGGVTIKGVTALREAGFHEIIAKAIDAIETENE